MCDTENSVNDDMNFIEFTNGLVKMANRRLDVGLGYRVGRYLHTSHEALQQKVIDFLVSILVGYGDGNVDMERFVDGRNTRAYNFCKQIRIYILANKTPYDSSFANFDWIRRNTDWRKR